MSERFVAAILTEARYMEILLLLLQSCREKKKKETSMNGEYQIVKTSLPNIYAYIIAAD